MRSVRAAAGLAGLCAVLACSPVSVSVDYDPSRDFSGYRSFAWFPQPQPRSGDYRIDNPLLDARIRAAVERELAAKGFQKVEDREPDFYVAYQLSIQQKLDVYTVNRGYIDSWGYVVAVPETQVREYDEGTLIVDIGDARAKQVVWRGVGRSHVEQGLPPERVTQNVNEAVAQILKRFPPS